MNKNTAHGIGVPWAARERNSLMSMSILANHVSYSQIAPKPTQRRGTHTEGDSTLVYALRRSSSLTYPAAPTNQLRGRYIKSCVSRDGYWFMHCPRCGYHFTELCLEPIGIYSSQAVRTEYGEYTGTGMGIGVYCIRCGLTDRLNIRGWQRRGFVPWWWDNP